MNTLEVAIELQKLSVKAMRDATSLAAIAQALLLGKTSKMHGVMQRYVTQGRSGSMQIGALAEALREDDPVLGKAHERYQGVKTRKRQDRETQQNRETAIEAASNVIEFQPGNNPGETLIAIMAQCCNEQEIRAAIRRRFAEKAQARQPDDRPDAG